MTDSRKRHLPESCDVPGFGPIDAAQVLAQDGLFVVVWDRYPVSPGHCLIVPKRSASLFGELLPREKARLMHWVDWCLDRLRKTLHPTPAGFNVGMNDGAAAGQTVPQFHLHIIPRYEGDVADPRGGVRFVIPQKARYWEQTGLQSTKAEGSPGRWASGLHESRFSAAKVAERVMAGVPFFCDLTETEKSTISNRSVKMFTLTGIRNATEALLAGLDLESEQDRVDMAIAFWTEVGKSLPEWLLACDRKVNPSDLRREFIHSHTLALAAIARAGNQLLAARPRGWKGAIKKLRGIDWRRSNTGLWEGRAMNTGRLSKHHVNVTLTANVVKQHLGLPLTASEERTEGEFENAHRGAKR